MAGKPKIEDSTAMTMPPPAVQSVRYLWASDVAFDGIRLEVSSEGKNPLFDISVGDDGIDTVNTFGNEVRVELLLDAINVAQERERDPGPLE